MEKRTSNTELKLKVKPDICWKTPVKRQLGENLMKNLGVAAALVLCAVALKSGALPGATGAVDAVLAAATDESLLDDHLGKLSFVSSLFPEATLVFGEKQDNELILPVSGGTVVHVWSSSEPYMSWRTSSRQVLAAGAGTVMGVYHGEDEERLIHIMGENGLSCLYGNLQDAQVSAGESVSPGDVLGTLLEERDCVFEVRQDGVSVDPAEYLGNVL